MTEEQKRRNLLGDMGQIVDDTLKTFQPQPRIIKSNKIVFAIGYITGGLTVGIMITFLFKIWELFV